MHPVCSSSGLHRARHGVLCSVSIARLRAALGNPPTSGALDIPKGNGDPAFSGAVDQLVINSTTYDFEPFGVSSN